MVLLQESIYFLGINVVNGKIQMQPHVSKKLSQFPDELPDTKSIQRFLGVLNYIHKYIPKLSCKTAPIRKYLKGRWSQEATTTVKALKSECQQLPKLQPLGDGLLILQTDASDIFWGAVLFEKREDDGEEKLCAYASGDFSPH